MIQVKDSLFTLHTAHTTYQFAADGNGFLLHTYYGPRAEGDFRRLLRFADRGFSPNPNALADGRVFSLDTLPQEYPASGVGDFRVPVIEARFADGSAAVDLRFERCEVRKGKYALEGCPRSGATTPRRWPCTCATRAPPFGRAAVRRIGRQRPHHARGAHHERRQRPRDADECRQPVP